MGHIQAVKFDQDTQSFNIGLQGHGLSRDEMVRMEGAHAAYCGYTKHDNPYRSQSADGVSWRRGFEAELQA